MGNSSSAIINTITNNDSELAERPLKRLKVSGSFVEGSDLENQTTSIALPPECWALVMDHLDYQSVLSCAATSKTILHDAIPLVKSLHIDNASEMNILLAKRFRDVQNINLFSLLKERTDEDDDDDDEMDHLSVDYDALLQMVPFLSQFHNLGRVFIGGRKVNGDIVSFCQAEDYWDEDEDPVKVRTLIDLVSGSFKSSGGLLSNVKVMGLRCPYSYCGNGVSDCDGCERACRCFPIDQVINFDNKGSSESENGGFCCKRMHFMDVCSSRTQIESIIEERPGGKALLQSNTRLLYLLGRGSMFEIRSEDRVPLYIVRYNGKQERELKRVIERYQLDVKELSCEDVTRAIRSSFATDEQSALPPKEQCYFSRSSIIMMNDLGLPINRLDFGYEAANAKNLPQIVKGIMSDNAPKTVQGICARLLSLVLKNSTGVEHSITTQKVINLGVVPKLVQCLDDGHTLHLHLLSVLYVLSNIAWKGSIDNVQVLVDAGIIPKLGSLMGSSDTKTAKRSTIALKFLAKKNAAIRDAVLQGGALTSLLNQAKKYYDNPELMKSNQRTFEQLLSGDPSPNLDDVPINMDTVSHLLSVGQAGDEKVLHYTCLALSFICRTQNSMHHNAMIESGLFPRLLDLTSSVYPKVQELGMETIRRLIRQDASLIERVVSDHKFPLFIACTQSPIEGVRTEASEVICCLLNGTKEQVAVFVGQGCVRALCSVLNFRHSSALATNALWGLTKILKLRMSDANPTGINVPDSEILCIKDKLCELESELTAKGLLKSLVDAVKDELEGAASKTSVAQNKDSTPTDIAATDEDNSTSAVKDPVGDIASIDAVRIAIGKKVFRDKCALTFQLGTKSPYIQFSFEHKGKLSEHRVYLKSEEVKEVKYHIPNEKETGEGEIDSDSMTMIAFRISPNDKNNLEKYSSSYNQEDSDDSEKTHKRYISVEVRDTDEFVAMLDQMRQHSDLGVWCTKDSEIEFYELDKYTKVLVDDYKKEISERMSISRRTRSGGSKMKKESENKLLLVYPFSVDEAILSNAASGLKELGGDMLGLESVEDNTSDLVTDVIIQGQSDVEDASDIKVKSSRTHYVTIRAEDIERLCPGQFLNDTLVDFWMRWICRQESKNPNSNVHFFTSHFMTTLKDDGPEAVASWTAKKNINIFEKKLIFIPVNADLHWSLCVVVNPGLIANYFDNDTPESEEHACILFLDSLKMQSKNTYAKHIRKWLNCEWKRLEKGPVAEQDAPFLISRDTGSMPSISPKIPYQANGCDCGVFVCRYAYNLFLMRHLKFTWKGVSNRFKSLITNGSAFQFDMDDVARMRDEIASLIGKLSRIYLDLKKKEKADKKSKHKASKSSIEDKKQEVGSDNANGSRVDGKKLEEDGETTERGSTNTTDDKNEDGDLKMSSSEEKENVSREDSQTSALEDTATERLATSSSYEELMSPTV